MRTFASIEDGSRIAPGTRILAPVPVFPKIDNSAKSAETVSAPLPVPTPLPVAAAVVAVVGMAQTGDTSSMSVDELSALIAAKGAEIRDLKGSKADKAVVKASVDELLALKQRYELMNLGLSGSVLPALLSHENIHRKL